MEENNELKNDIKRLLVIYEELESHYFEDVWNLSDIQERDLYRITNLEDHDWDEEQLKLYISGMQRALQLQERYSKIKTFECHTLSCTNQRKVGFGYCKKCLEDK